MITKSKYSIIQLHAALTLFGYWCVHSVVTLFSGGSSRLVSIGYDVFQLVLSTYVIAICFRDIISTRKKAYLTIYSILLLLYSARMFLDMWGGPYIGQLPQSVFMNDILQTVFHTFLGAWAMIASVRYLNIDRIVKWTFYLGLIAVLCAFVSLRTGGIDISYEEERLSYGGGLGTLALVKIGAIEVIAALHIVLNSKKGKLFYLAGGGLGLWICFASGSRGGIVGLVIALLFFWLMSSRRNVLLSVIAIVGVILFIINLEPILIWLGDFFPILSRRMLNTILEHDEGNRELLRQAAYDRIWENPIFGYSYRLRADLTGYGCHNGILDFTLALGIPAGIVFAVSVYGWGIIMAARMMSNKRLFFPSVMAIFAFTASMTGNATDGVFCFAVVLLAAAYYYNSGENRITGASA